MKRLLTYLKPHKSGHDSRHPPGTPHHRDRALPPDHYRQCD